METLHSSCLSSHCPLPHLPIFQPNLIFSFTRDGNNTVNKKWKTKEHTEMDKKSVVEEACKISEPLSHRAIDEITESYPDDSTLPKRILMNPTDFQSEFIHKHTEFVTAEGGCRIRTCHNLNLRNDKSDSVVYVFIHGLGGTLTQFEPLLKLLSLINKGFFSMDLPGFGSSDDVESYGMLEIVAIVQKTFAKLTPSRNLVLIGHSMGCYLAIHFCSAFQEQYSFQELVLLAPPSLDLPQVERTSTRVLMSLLFRWPWMFDIYRTQFDQSRGLRSSGIVQFFYNRNKQNKYRLLYQFYHNVQIRSKSLAGYILGWKPISEDQLTTVASATSKVLLFAGDQDGITPASCARLMYDTMVNVGSCACDMVILQDCSHNMCLDAPSRIVASFFDHAVV